MILCYLGLVLDVDVGALGNDLVVLDAAESNGFEAGKVLTDTGYYSEANIAGA